MSLDTDNVWLAAKRKYILLAFASYAIVGGLLSLCGWIADVPRLASWDNSGISIQPNATVAVIAAGVAIVLLELGYRRVATVFAIFVSLIGASSLFQYITDIDLEQLNTLLMFDRPWGRVGVISPGRMGPPGATCWTLLGMALVFAGRDEFSKWRGIAPQLALFTFSIAALSSVGYLYRVDKLFSLPRLTVIALQTSTFIAAVSLALIASIPEQSPMRWLLARGATGSVARRAVPAVIIGPFAIGWLRVSGESLGWYDTRFGVAIFVLLMVTLLLTVLAWSLSTISRHEAALRLSERRLRDTLESITDGFVTLDRDGSATFVNDEAARLFRQDRGELLGRNIWELFKPAAGGIAFHEMKRAASERISVAFEEYEPQMQRWFFTKVYPIEDGGLAVYFDDITDRKHAEQELLDANRRKDEFLATLAHELRGPLAPMANSLELMERSNYSESMLRKASDILRRQLKQMVRLVDDLLDVSRISRDKVELQKSNVELQAIVDHAIETCAHSIQKLNHNLVVKLPREPIILNADAARLVQVIGNLLNNACKYTPPGGRIELSAVRNVDDVVVTLKDSGVGLPRDKVGLVFDLFTQLGRSVEQQQGGLGIGLYLVKRVVEMHGGVVTVHSEGENRGSEFTIRLPVAPIAAVTIQTSAQKSSANG